MHPLGGGRRVELRLDIPPSSDPTHFTPCVPYCSPLPTIHEIKENTPPSSPSFTWCTKDPLDTPRSPSHSNLPSPSSIHTMFEEFYNMSRSSSPSPTPCSSSNVIKNPSRLPQFNSSTTPFSPNLNQTATYLYSPTLSPTSAHQALPLTKKNLARSFSHPQRQQVPSSSKMHRSSSLNSCPSQYSPSSLPVHPHPQPQEDTSSPRMAIQWTPSLPFSVQALPCSSIGAPST